MIVSIVTGTYNRLQHLKSMIESVRFSIGLGLSYEIVVVDGGSTDGTAEWALSQKDVYFIQQGELLGAVKAFNEGAYKAHGQYVILANDDIIFINESILAAVSFMQDNPNVGVGCFYQDRGEQSWHVSRMSAVHNGKSIGVYYGQVCIVPKMLGDYVGWWGDYLRTYGGDNELSCNVLELGYAIEPIPCACIHDVTIDDELRTKNNPTLAPGVSHPDTAAWLQKWTRNGKLGPIIPENVETAAFVERRKRVSYAPIYEKGFEIQKRTKHGLRDALTKAGCLVSEVDWVSAGIGKLYDTANCWRPELYIIQAHNANDIPADIMLDLRRISPDSKFVLWNGDYHPEHLFNISYVKMLEYFDLVGLVTTNVPANLFHNVNWFYWQVSYEDADNTPLPSTPKHDIVFLANGYSKERVELAKFLNKLPYNVGIYGHWSGSIKHYQSNLYDFDAGARLYKAAEFAISDNQYPEATGYVSNRLFQAMAAGVLVLQQRVSGMDELLGYKSGIHYIEFASIKDIPSILQYYIDNEEERLKIARAGQEFTHSNHSFDHRVLELMERIK